MLITQQQVKEVLIYNPLTGDFTWRTSSGGVVLGSSAGYNRSDGYKYIGLGGKQYLAHRLAFLYMTGVFPKEMVDHRDVDRSNNIWTNLRSSSRMENGCNIPLRKGSTSGVKGVSWHKASKKWRARVQVSGVRIFEGLYEDLELANLVVTEARELYHGDFARHA